MTKGTTWNMLDMKFEIAIAGPDRWQSNNNALLYHLPKVIYLLPERAKSRLSIRIQGRIT
ncbi:MAG: hypothetical protein R3E73_09620 [Porticoccaceae bacterium]